MSFIRKIKEIFLKIKYKENLRKGAYIFGEDIKEGETFCLSLSSKNGRNPIIWKEEK
jgi:hypothetical protein